MRGQYLLQTASTRELLCGEWERKDSTVSFRIYIEDGKYYIEIEDGKYYIEFRYGNKINNYKKCLSSELLEDKEGNLYADFMNQGIGYDPKQDLLLVEDYGAFKRKMETEHEK